MTYYISPILFNIVADMLAILINRAKEEGPFDGIIPHLVDGGLSSPVQGQYCFISGS